MIPSRLVRTVPRETSDEVEAYWAHATALHPTWQHVTLRDPVDPAGFPHTRHLWGTCESGAQLADLIRAEYLYWHGGVYLDSDVEVYRSFQPLMVNEGFAAWEDERHIPNAVMGFEKGHPALSEVIKLAVERHFDGTWAAGVGVTTEVFTGRDDMLLLPPDSFYPYHYSFKDAYQTTQARERVKAAHPWAFCAHHWRHSWK
jgi:hypothetical protein